MYISEREALAFIRWAENPLQHIFLLSNEAVFYALKTAQGLNFAMKPNSKHVTEKQFKEMVLILS
jgi:hypothetical protein